MSRSNLYAILIVLAGIGLRLATYPLSLGCDEPQTAAIALSPGWPQFWAAIANDSNPPLIHLILRGWAAVFGGSDDSLRACVLVISSALPLICFVLFHRSFSERIALQLAALAACSLPFLIHTEKVRSYGLMVILTMSASWVLMRLLSEGGRRRSLRYATLLGASLWTHGSSILVAGTHGLLLTAGMLSRRLTTRQFRDGAVAWAVCIIFMFVPLVLVLLHNAHEKSSPILHSVNPLVQLVLVPIVAIGGSHDVLGVLTAVLFWGAFFVCLRYREQLARDYEGTNFWLAVLICMVLVEFVIGIFVMREPYLLHFSVPCMLIYLLACDRLLIDRHRIVRAVLPVALLAALWAPGVVRLMQNRDVSGVKQATALVNAESRPVVFVVSREWLVATAARYLKPSVEVLSLPHLRPANIIDYTGMEQMLRDDGTVAKLENELEERLRRGVRVYHLMSAVPAGFSAAPGPDEDFEHLEYRRSLEVEEWLTQHARRVEQRQFRDCAGFVVLEVYDPI